MATVLAVVRPIRPVEREVLEFALGIKAYEPTPGGRWRVRWIEAGRRRDTSALTRDDAVAKATALVERLSRGVATDLARATGAHLVAHYLDPARTPPKVDRWSDKHRDAQERWCRGYVLPELGHIPCAKLTRLDFQRILDRATTPATAQHLRRCLTGIVNAGLEEGYLLALQDVLRGVRWQRPGNELIDLDDELIDDEEDDERAVDPAEIPTTDAVHALAHAVAEASGSHRRAPGMWWRELEILLVAYSGMRWGEHAALRAGRVDALNRRIAVHRQVVEVGGSVKLALPKGRRRRTTAYPEVTPGGVDLAALVERRLAEVGSDGLLFPAPRGGWARRSNYGRNLWDPAAATVDWPRREIG